MRNLCSKNKSIKPIFHQNAKYLASGAGVGQCTRRQNCALPNAKYTNMLVYFALGNAHFLRFTRRVLPDAFYPTRFIRRQSVEYRWRWVFWPWPCIFHVYFMYISCCLCTFFRVGNAKNSRRKGRFQWNTGFSRFLASVTISELYCNENCDIIKVIR